MKTHKLHLTFIFFLLFAFNSLKSNSQIILKDISERINKSAFIFEGEVLGAYSYWNDDKTYIYTDVKVLISKIFKGDLQCGT